MESRITDKRKEAMVVDIDMLVPKEHLLRKIDKVMDYEWLYARLEPYYKNKYTGRPNADPVVLIKMVLIQHLYGIRSLRQTWREIDMNIAYRWFLGYDLLESIPHFATVSYAFCQRFPAELSQEIFEHILNKAINNRMVDPSIVYIDGTHIKANANKKKYQKQQVKKAAKIYDEELRAEVNAERKKLGKEEIEDGEDKGPPPTEGRTVSTTDPESGMFVKGEHERQFAYEAHTACDRHGMVMAVEVTPGNIHDSVAFDKVYEELNERFPEMEMLVMDSAYKTPWITRRIVKEGGRLPILPYTRYNGKKDKFKPWDFQYDIEKDEFQCPNGNILKHTTTDREGKRTYRSNRKECRGCPLRERCGAKENGERVLHRHIWQEFVDIAEALRKEPFAKEIYSTRQETIERVFADAKEKHAMRYTTYRGLARVTNWVRLKYAAMNLKKLAIWMNKESHPSPFSPFLQLLAALFPCPCLLTA